MPPETETGKISIFDEMLTAVIADASLSIRGVAAMDESIINNISVSMIGYDITHGHGVRISRHEGETVLDVYVTVSYGTKIPALAWKLQQRISCEMEKLTGEHDPEVNIHVQGVV